MITTIDCACPRCGFIMIRESINGLPYLACCTFGCERYGMRYHLPSVELKPVEDHQIPWEHRIELHVGNR